MKYDIVLTGTVGCYPLTTQNVAEQMAAKEDSEELHVFLSSFGGDLQTAMQIRALFKARGGVVCHLDGYVASAATVIATGAAETLIAPTAQYLVHRTRCTADVYGQGLTADEIEREAKELQKTAKTLTQADAALAAMYAEKTGKEADEMLALMDEGKWLSASEAVSYGFADLEEAQLSAGETGEKKAEAFANVAKLCAAYGLPSPTGAAAPTEERKGGQWLRDLIAGFSGKAETDRLKKEAADARAEAETLRAKIGELETAAAEAEDKARELAAAMEALEAEKAARTAERDATEAALRAEIESLKKADGAADGTAGLETVAAEADAASVRTRYEALAHLL